MDYLKDQGFVLKTMPYAEADLIAYILTKSNGVLHFFIRSARKSKKRFSGGVIEPPHLIEFESNRMKLDKVMEEGSLISLKEARLLQDFPKLRTEYKNIETLSLLVKVVLSAEQNVEQGVFNQFGSALRLLPFVKNHRRFFSHFVVRYLFMEGVLPAHMELNDFIKFPLAKHNELSDVSKENIEKEVVLASHFLQTYSSRREALKWPQN